MAQRDAGAVTRAQYNGDPPLFTGARRGLRRTRAGRLSGREELLNGQAARLTASTLQPQLRQAGETAAVLDNGSVHPARPEFSRAQSDSTGEWNVVLYSIGPNYSSTIARTAAT
jgi:hypothetical protein